MSVALAHSCGSGFWLTRDYGRAEVSSGLKVILSSLTTNMRRSFAILGLLLIMSFPAIARSQDIIRVSVAPTVVHATFGQPVYLIVTVTNTSPTSRYIGRNVIGSLEYSVKNSTGHVLRGLSDPPAPPPTPYEDQDLIWLKPGEAISFNQQLTLSSLGIESIGQFRVVAFLNGTVATGAEWRTNKYGFFFSFAPAVTVMVENALYGTQRK
jgi:hypothetical protein